MSVLVASFQLAIQLISYLLLGFDVSASPYIKGVGSGEQDQRINRNHSESPKSLIYPITSSHVVHGYLPGSSFPSKNPSFILQTSL